MTITGRIVGLLLIFLIYIMLSELYLKRTLHIKEVRKSILSEGRKKLFIIIEIILIFLFVYSTFYFMDTPLFILPTFLFSTCLYFFRGIEEWHERKSEKGYYQEWLTSLTFFVMFLFMLFGEF
ncbi:DUF4181 domain-containing protein [Fredinandcohnia onubensis]|uniref:DUF4181 domain-containing protein n=1 Tax=Fredinandcohnia onubensis TaxID=1571209 RepID=UPI000C0BD299|nr:DUF4181 domain-containing protein [Fredinandcohnia onubensis]